MANPITQVQVGGTTYDVKDAGAVRKVNGTSPDANGNVQIETGSDTLPASSVTSGTFAGQVVANASAQTPGTSLLRNSKLVSADTTPTNNGEIFWTYG